MIGRSAKGQEQLVALGGKSAVAEPAGGVDEHGDPDQPRARTRERGDSAPGNVAQHRGGLITLTRPGSEVRGNGAERELRRDECRRAGFQPDAIPPLPGVSVVRPQGFDVFSALTGRSEERAADLIGGLATVVFGVLALSWPDITIFLVGLLFGVRTVLFGLSQLVAVYRRWRQPALEAAAAVEEPPSRFRRGLRIATRSLALILALLLLAVSVAFRRQKTEVSAFYDTPDPVPSTPGELLDREPLDADLPDNAQAWRILYSTTSSVGEPAVGSAFVLAPDPLTSEPSPLILWTHGTVGIERPCAPSLFDDITAGVPSVPQALQNGWVMVAPDYVGMGTEGDFPYLIGTGQAYSSLDAARAVQQFEEVSLDPEQTVVWGHSQGGNAALWTGLLAGDYAPDLTIDGVAALAPASDLVPLAQRVQGAAAGTVVTAFFLTSYANTYDDVRLEDYVQPGATVTVREAAERCLTDPSLAASLIAASGGESLFSTDLSAGPLGERLRENTPTADMSMPLLVAAGTGDEVINIAINELWVAQQCDAGYELDFRTYPDRTHMGVLDADSPLTEELTAWTVDRFAGDPADSTC